jgi:hypothetical protein
VKRASEYGYYSFRNRRGSLQSPPVSSRFDNMRELQAHNPFENRLFRHDLVREKNAQLEKEYAAARAKRQQAHEAVIREWKIDCWIAEGDGKRPPEKPQPEDDGGEQEYFWVLAKLEPDQQQGALLIRFRNWPHTGGMIAHDIRPVFSRS